MPTDPREAESKALHSQPELGNEKTKKTHIMFAAMGLPSGLPNCKFGTPDNGNPPDSVLLTKN
jgi:hypothetical protein